MIGVNVADWMTAKPIFVTPEMTLENAHQLMETHNIRHLPVLSGQRLISLLTKRDIRRSELSVAATYGRGEMRHMVNRYKTVAEIITYNPPTIGPDEPITTAAEQLLTKHVTALPVVDEHKHLLGIVTESDLFRLIVQTLAETETVND